MREQHYLIGRTSRSDRNTAGKSHCLGRTATSNCFLARSAVLQHSFRLSSCMQIHASAQAHLLRVAAAQPHKQTNPNTKVSTSAAFALTLLHFHLESPLFLGAYCRWYSLVCTPFALNLLMGQSKSWSKGDIKQEYKKNGALIWLFLQNNTTSLYRLV